MHLQRLQGPFALVYAESAGARSALTGERHSATLASAGGAAASSRLDKEVRCREHHE